MLYVPKKIPEASVGLSNEGPRDTRCSCYKKAQGPALLLLEIVSGTRVACAYESPRILSCFGARAADGLASLLLMRVLAIGVAFAKEGPIDTCCSC